MYAFSVRLRYANPSNIMLDISNSLFNYCNVTITLYAYILVCFLVPLASKQRKLCYSVFGTIIFYGSIKIIGAPPPPPPPPPSPSVRHWILFDK